MINLIPLNTRDINYLFELVSQRNSWFIKLRYIAVILLLGFYFILLFIGSEEFFPEQKLGILLVFFSIFIYNLLLSIISGKDVIKNDVSAFNPMKFALLQIILDLSSLMILVYITGLINSPFYLFFIFHAIIGSLILPGSVVYLLMVIVLLVFSLLNIFTHFGLISEFPISVLSSIKSLDTYYLFLNLLSFWLMILLSVMFVNYLTSALYRREQELIEAIQKIESAESEKQKYIMAVVHEVKSPLSVIVSYLNLLLSGIYEGINDNVKEILVKMKKRSDDAIVLTNDILNVSRIRQLKELKKENIDPLQITGNIIENLKDKGINENITFTIKSNLPEGTRLIADKHFFELLISNVISNAVKFNQKNGKVEVMIFSEDGNICIQVSDSGIGIPQDELSKISDEFYRSREAKSRGIEGTGLGMHTVRQIAEKHGGSLKVMSPSGIGNKDFPGTTVEIRLPAIE
ncbi:MAG: Sensor histidine kinase RcsC [Ignavibacteria bacterium]|nr:Sensor histidine kinase RcsC [Ignavibacteria bacterium]